MSVHLAWLQPRVGRFALFYLGFRPFFLLAALAATGLGIVWLLALNGSAPPTAWPQPTLWHGHEMIFGFGMAVIAGFLLTAIRNWTSIQTLHRWPLALLAALWLGARLANLSHGGLVVAAVLDALFDAGLAVAVTAPVVRARQWRQIGLISKVWLLGLTNFASYALADTAHLQPTLLFGLLLIVAVLLTMIHRVLPFFIEKAAQMKHGRMITLSRFQTLQKWNLTLFLAFSLGWLFWPHATLTALLALILALLNGWVLLRWADRAVFGEPLLWSLWGGYAFVVMGFALAALNPWLPAVGWLSVHAFGAGGMGLTTLGMMIRVTLGHTGRNIFKPGRLAGALLAMVLIAALFRVFGPLLLPHTPVQIMTSALIFWIMAFGLFTLTFTPMWLKPRIDGHYG